MNKRNREIEKLDKSLKYAQLDKFIEDFDREMHKRLKKTLKKAALLIIPFIFSFIGFAYTHDPLFMVIGGVIPGVIGIASALKSAVKGFLVPGKDGSKVTPEDDELKEVLERGISKSKGEDYYREEYKMITEDLSQKTSDQEKYEEALERQSAIRSSVSETYEFLNCQDTKKRILEELDVYIGVYDLPPFNFSNEQLDIFMEELYALFLSKYAEISFYRVMSELLRHVCSKALINKASSITIYDFIDNLQYIRGGYGNLGMGQALVDTKEIEELSKKLRFKINSSKIIEFKLQYIEKH